MVKQQVIVQKPNRGWWIVILVILGIALVIFLMNSSAREGVCGTHTETYESSAKGCDQRSNCDCLHKSWGGLGACDSCECTRQVSNC